MCALATPGPPKHSPAGRGWTPALAPGGEGPRGPGAVGRRRRPAPGRAGVTWREGGGEGLAAQAPARARGPPPPPPKENKGLRAGLCPPQSQAPRERPRWMVQGQPEDLGG